MCVCRACGGVQLKSRFSCQTSLTSVSCITALINNTVHWRFLVGNCPDSPPRLVSISTWPAPRSIRNGLCCRCLEVTWTPQREAGFIYRLSFIMCPLKTTESFKKRSRWLKRWCAVLLRPPLLVFFYLSIMRLCDTIYNVRCVAKQKVVFMSDWARQLETCCCNLEGNKMQTEAEVSTLCVSSQSEMPNPRPTILKQRTVVSGWHKSRGCFVASSVL